MTPGAVWLLAAALWAGCLAPGPGWLAAAGLAVAVAATRLQRDAHRLAALACALALAGSGLAGGRLALQEHGVLAEAAEQRRTGMVTATAVTEPRATARGVWQIVRVTGFAGTPVRERAVLRLGGDTRPAELGQRITARAALEPLGRDGFDRHLRSLHAVAALRPLGPIEVSGDAGAILRATTVVRERTRAAARTHLDEDRAALLTALVIGDRRGESPERRMQFAASSLTHLVVVSGKHVGLVLAGVVGLAALLRVGPRPRAWLALGALGWYVVLVRWQPSVLRAGLMAAVVLAAVLAGRRADPRHALGVAVVLLLLLDPFLARHLGFALSVSATAGVLLGAPWLASRLPGPRWLRLPAAICLGAQAGVTPLLVHLEGGVPVAALPANLLAVPAASAAQAVGLVAAVTAQVSVPAGGVVALLAGPPLGAVLWVAETFADWPLLTPSTLATPAVAALLLALLLRARAPRVAAVAAVAALLLAVVPASAPSPRIDTLTVTLLDVGQGDALLLEVPAVDDHPSVRLLVDGGPEAGAALAHLRARRIRRLDAVVLSHPHHDHSGGLAAVMRRMPAGALLVGPDALDERAARSAHETYAVARERQIPIVALAAGERIRVGAAALVALSPPADGSVGTDLNEISLVLRLDHPDGRVLLTGDAEVLAQTLMLREREALRAEVLKVPHHGGDTNAPGFLAAPEAAVALIGVGRDNPFGHPTARVLDELALAGPAVYRSDLHGSVRVRLRDGAVVEVVPDRVPAGERPRRVANPSRSGSRVVRSAGSCRSARRARAGPPAAPRRAGPRRRAGDGRASGRAEPPAAPASRRARGAWHTALHGPPARLPHRRPRRAARAARR